MKFYIVGGAVRDSLMDKVPKDFDYVVVGATPDDMEALGLKQVGADFPVFINDEGVEYALARIERKTGVGYNGFVTDHSKDVTLAEDLLRRDLTINAIAQDDCTGEIFDPYNGQYDIENKILRHVSAAFAEDPVRVLRLARFLARFGGGWRVADETTALVIDMIKRGELNHLTRERVLKEMEKALSEPNPDRFFMYLRDVGALKVIMPELLCSNTDFGLLFAAKGGSVAFNYARITDLMTDVGVRQFEDRMNVSTEWRRYSKMYRIVMSFQYRDNLVDVLYRLDAYRQPSVWDGFIEDLRATGYSRNDLIKQLINAWWNTKDIGFNSLSLIQKETLVGPNITDAIKQKRKEWLNG